MTDPSLVLDKSARDREKIYNVFRAMKKRTSKRNLDLNIPLCGAFLSNFILVGNMKAGKLEVLAFRPSSSSAGKGRLSFRYS